MTTSTTRPVSVAEIARLAEAVLPRDVWDYVAGGAGEERTVQANRDAFHRLSVLPRVLVDVANRSARTSALGTPVAAPVGIAPTSYHVLAHPDGELATVRAAGTAGVLTIQSVFSSVTLEDVAAAATGPLWFQLYCLRDRAVTRNLIERAAAAGYRAIVLGVDLPVIGYRDRDIRNGFGLPPHIRPVNLPVAADSAGGLELTELNDILVSPDLTWRDVEWVRGLSSLPLVVKGVLAADDARRAVDAGAQGVLVSNHGGRQIDGSVATMTALPEVLDAVGDRCEVYLDGGVRRGTDVLKAVALGARMAFVGRPVMWGLAADGEAGVGAVLRMYLEELDLVMAVCGCPDVASIGPDLLRTVPA
ncbi:alpha-hydroxy acid oxidase [Solwaraspora sp. WMMD406]|uniref:alpha-hydroxy acid oxidase n=1 Tax=Solwaraspora sp. WMMD406 TaxID=3016095 RepID=UPI00241677B5|nr:alpha-hydroxy acid oxidase [Solwaraspora sp. WMMD406]MDG4766917.1 alpha-hydroxy acid oxidase [Solwaraspora sp. WMMD406]